MCASVFIPFGLVLIVWELGHRFDYDTPIEETMQALNDVVKAGYVRYIGMSSCYAWQCKSLIPPLSETPTDLSCLLVHKMQAYARQHNLTEFISMQNLHNAIYREEEREMVPLLQDLGVGMIPWSPLARGFLCRDINEQTSRAKTDGYVSPNLHFLMGLSTLANDSVSGGCS